MTSIRRAGVRFIALAACAAVAAGLGTVRHVRAQPTGSGLPTSAPDLARGRLVFQNHCVKCHGPSGKGDGPAATVLAPRPRDFTTAKYKIRTTESGSVPTDDDLAQSTRQGLYGTAMPAWDGLLTPAEILDVVTYVKSFSPRFINEIPIMVDLGSRVPSSPDSIARGRQVYDTLQCGKCHGSDGRGAGAVATEFQDDWQQPLAASDLTQPWTFHGGATSRDIYLRFRTGMSGTPMPSFKDAASDRDMWDLANYVVALGRKPVWAMSAAEIRPLYAAEERDATANPARRGRYLVEAFACPVCHSPVVGDGRIPQGLKMAGGLLIRIVPFGDYPTGNLTSDRETGLGNWTDDEIKRVLTRGIRRDGTRLLPFPMDWPSYANLKSSDIDAMVAYLRTIPPVYNKVPPPKRTFLPLYLWGKFRMLILNEDLPILVYGGNLGTTREAR